METQRIAQLLQPFLNFQAEESLLQNISTYIDVLLHWNARINLTAVRDREKIVTRHFGESLFTARHLFPDAGNAAARPADPIPAYVGASIPDGAPGQQRLATEPGRLVDVGSGPGFPGLPIKLWAPDIQLTLIESNRKKATFLREISRALTLTSVDVFSGRAEDFPAATADVVTLRAVEQFESILPTAARLVRPGGRLALLIGEVRAAQVPALTPAFHWTPPHPIPLSAARVLLVGQTSQEPNQ